MLQKVAIHQTRLKVPGVTVDARGVCLGTRGLVLLPSWDRLVAFLAIYTGEHSLTRVLGSLEIHRLSSELGAREIAVSFDAVSSDVMDSVADVSRLTGGFTFTGTSRHFVQYRDADAPFGYDAPELLANDAEFCLYHRSFSQAYRLQGLVDFRNLVLSLDLHRDQAPVVESGTAWVLAAPALGPVLARYLARSNIPARLSSLRIDGEDHRPEQGRWLFRLESFPGRCAGLLTRTPGLSLYHRAAEQALVRHGYRHPLTLAACPVFRSGELVLFPGENEAAIVLSEPPLMADVEALVQPALRDLAKPVTPRNAESSEPVHIPTRLRLLPKIGVSQPLAAMRLVGRQREQLRRLAYLLSAATLEATLLAASDEAVFIVQAAGVQPIALGNLYTELGAGLYGPLGYQLSPRLGARLVREALGVPESHLAFLETDGSCQAIDRAAFAPLARALLEPLSWSEPRTFEFTAPLEQELPVLWLEPLGMLPLGRAGRKV